MNILCQGSIFVSGPSAWQSYSGPHEIRVMVGHPELSHIPHHVRYDFHREAMTDILHRLGDWQPDLILFWQPEDQPPPRGVENVPVRTVAIPSDWNHAFPRLVENLKRFDIVACDLPGVHALKRHGVAAEWFGPVYGYEPDLHRHLDVPRDIDVLYAGSLNPALRPERAAFLKRLEALAHRYRIVIRGDVYGEAYVQLMNRARLVFNHSVRGELNMRSFEAWACGGVQMLEASNVEGQTLLKQEESVVFYEEDNLEQRIASSLADTPKCDQIRARQFALAQAYAPANRIDALVDWAMSQTASGRHFRSLPPQDRAFHDVMALTDSYIPGVSHRENEAMRAYLEAWTEDPRAWTLAAKHLLTPVLHLYLRCNDVDRRRGPVRQALLKAAACAPDDALYQMNAAWACAFAGDDAGHRRALEAVLGAEHMEIPWLLIGGVTEPFWVAWMKAAAHGEARLETLKAEAARRLEENGKD